VTSPTEGDAWNATVEDDLDEDGWEALHAFEVAERWADEASEQADD
jgi:hypothetical protein